MGKQSNENTSGKASVTRGVLGSVKNRSLDVLTDTAVVDTSTNFPYGIQKSISSLKDVDIHSITEKVHQTYQNADIGTWAYNPSVNYSLFKASIEMTKNEKEITLNTLGYEAATNGDGTIVMSNRNKPSVTQDFDYITNYQKDKNTLAKANINVTQTSQPSVTDLHYSGVDEKQGTRHNDLYSTSHNLFFDDEDKLVRTSSTGVAGVDNIISPGSNNSILNKTKRLFQNNKINTIVSAFHGRKTSPVPTGSAVTKEYGMSHGHNLLLKSAEDGDNTYSKYSIHGYDNPYCRVWTHHYQYNRRDRLIRPFVTFEDPEREETTSTDIAEFHNFARLKDSYKNADGEYGWKSGNVGWEMSVLHNDSKNGIVNIAPKYSSDPEHKSIRPIDCMFSIENLAWQGYDPYSFEKALSNEQRGPMGGRIMWFPPYDLSFQESVSCNWQPYDFIGRGETVHTYKNTQRTGTLSFTILVDHPSYTDLLLAHNGQITTGKTPSVKDTDILRFFEGCDIGEIPDIPDNPDQPTYEPEPVPLENLKKFSFFVFYPNNYSGVHDKPGQSVEAIPYLLAGTGAQKANNIIPTKPISAETKKKQEKLKKLKEWLIETYPNKWGITAPKEGNTDTSPIKALSDYVNAFPLMAMVSNYDGSKLISDKGETLLANTMNSKDQYAMYTGHYDKADDFFNALYESTNNDLEKHINEILKEFVEFGKTKFDTQTDPESVAFDFLYAHLLNPDNLDGLYGLENYGWLNESLYDAMESSKMKETAITSRDCLKDEIDFWFLKLIVDNLFAPLLNLRNQNLINGDGDDWSQTLSDLLEKVKNEYFSYISDTTIDCNGELKRKLSFHLDNAIDDYGELVTLTDPHTGTDYYFTPEMVSEFKRLSQIEFDANHVIFLDGTFNNCNQDDMYYIQPDSELGAKVYYIAAKNGDNSSGSYQNRIIDTNLSFNYTPSTTLEIYTHTLVNTYVIASITKNPGEKLTLDDFVNSTETLEHIKAMLEDEFKGIIPAFALPLTDAYYRGCFFTTPHRKSDKYVDLNYYDITAKSWNKVKIESTSDIVYGNNITNDTKEHYISNFYFDYYPGMLSLLGLLDESYYTELTGKYSKGVVYPSKENLTSNYGAYNILIKKMGKKSPYDYYNVFDANRAISSEKDVIYQETASYLTTDDSSLEVLTNILTHETSLAIGQSENLKSLFNTTPSNNSIAIQFTPTDMMSFSDVMDGVFKAIYETESNIKAETESVSSINHENTISVTDESDIPISMEKLFDADGVGYEMLKLVNTDGLPDELTYTDVYNSGKTYGVSNVRRSKFNPINGTNKNISYQFKSKVDENLREGEMPGLSHNPNLEWDVISDNHIKGTFPNWQQNKSTTYTPRNNGLKNWDGYDYIPWYYRIDGKYTIPKSQTDIYENYYDQFLQYNREDKVITESNMPYVRYSNYRDTATYGLNCNVEMVKKAFGLTDESLDANKETLYSLAEVAYAITDDKKVRDAIVNQGLLLNENNSKERIETLEQLLKSSKTTDQSSADYKIVKIEALGYSNSHANNASQNVNTNRNEHLAQNRAKTVVDWFKQNLKGLDTKVYQTGIQEIQSSPSTSVGTEPNGINDVSSLKAKQYRSAKITIYCQQEIDKAMAEAHTSTIRLVYPDGSVIEVDKSQTFEHNSVKGKMFYKSTDGKHFVNALDRTLWQIDPNTGNLVMIQMATKTTKSDPNSQIAPVVHETNKLRYDNEWLFFRELQIKDPIVFGKLVNKLQVFDPAFHSMTPEGFNARLTFLHQCTRQGDTHTLSDTNRSTTPKNLQFGKAPVCILRIGDFFHQQILISNMSISYEPLIWDLNTEGIGVQPMLAKVQLSVTFVGGSDMAGAVQRLQNAATFNYYANTRLYDNRADRVYYKDDQPGVIDVEKTYSHSVPYVGVDVKTKK